MQIDLSRFRDVFFDEAVEHHRELEAGLLRLEAAHDDREALDAVFRAAHSIKGSSGAFDLPEITRYTHALESLLEQMRRRAVALTPALIGLLLRAADVLRDLVAGSRSGGRLPEVSESIAELEAAWAHAVPPHASAGPGLAAVGAAPPGPCGPRIVHVGITPKPQLLRRGSDPLLLLRELAQIGTLLDVQADLSSLPELASLDPERCHASWKVRLETTASVERLREVFVFVEGDCEVVIDEPGEAMDPARVEPADERAAERRTGLERRQGDSGSLRVPAGKVDHLMDLVGELVIAQSMVSQLMHAFAPERMPLLREAVSGMERNLRDLQAQVMSVRMVTIGTVFARLPRLVRDLAAATGKDIALHVSGEETELDKGMIERVSDPLLHLVRNCVDHGIEAPEDRRRAGKPAQGVISVRALHEGGNVTVEVADDGRGLDPRRLLARAIALGLLPEGSQPGEAELRDLIFRPGFSTAERVSDISGRGVGMDVVKRNVENLGGTVHLESRPGSGTTFRLRVPLTLAILDGLLMAVGSHTFILPLLAVVESVRLRPGELHAVPGRGEVALVRGQPLPLLRLARLLDVGGAREEATHGIAVILDHAGDRVALLVDGLVGQSQVVIKNLDANFGRLDGVMGATILGNGAVALILDPQGLVRLASRAGRSPAGAPGGATARELQGAQA